MLSGASEPAKDCFFLTCAVVFPENLCRNICTWEDPTDSQFWTIPLGICLKTAGSLCQEGKGLHCSKQASSLSFIAATASFKRGSSPWERNSLLPKARLLLHTGIAIFASTRFSQVLPVPAGHGLWLHFLPEKNDQTEQMDADLYSLRQQLYLWTDCPYSVIVLSQDTRSVHGTFLLLVLPDQYVGIHGEACIPNVLESNDAELHWHYNRHQLELNFQEAKIICTLNKYFFRKITDLNTIKTRHSKNRWGKKASSVKTSYVCVGLFCIYT